MTEKFYHLSKKEIIFLVAVILIYSVVGYWNLGSRVEPQTYYDRRGHPPQSLSFRNSRRPSRCIQRLMIPQNMWAYRYYAQMMA